MGDRRRTTVFVSYRRDDSAGHAGRLVDSLRSRLGTRADVFLDIDGIRPGHDFVEVIRRTIEGCTAVLVVIGPDWLDARDDAGNRRLDDPDDFVLLEIEAALASGVQLIPLLVGDAEMPAPTDLPPSIRPLARREALELDDRRFQVDVDELAALLAPPPAAGRLALARDRRVIAGAAAALLVIAVLGWAILRGGDAAPTAPGGSGTSADAPPAAAGGGKSGAVEGTPVEGGGSGDDTPTAPSAAGSAPGGSSAPPTPPPTGMDGAAGPAPPGVVTVDVTSEPPGVGSGAVTAPPTPPPDVASLPPSALTELLPALATGCVGVEPEAPVIDAETCGDGSAAWRLMRFADHQAADEWIAGMVATYGGSGSSWRDTSDLVGRVAFLDRVDGGPASVLWDYWEPGRADGVAVWAVVDGTQDEVEQWWEERHVIAPAQDLRPTSTGDAPTSEPGTPA